MKKILIITLVSALFLLSAHIALAIPITYSGAWEPNDQDIFAIQISATSTNPGFLYIYDFDEGITDDLFVLSDTLNATQQVWFQYIAGTWYADTTPGGMSLNLGGSDDFGFYFQKGPNTYTSYLLTTLIPGDAYELEQTSARMKVVVHDASPVPEPSTILLLGAGLLGLALYRRRK